MGKPPLAEMQSFALIGLLKNSASKRGAVVREMCARWPDAPALSIVFAISKAAGQVEEIIHEAPTDNGIATSAYKLASILAVDIHAIENAGKNQVMARDLFEFWRNVDRWFLDI